MKAFPFCHLNPGWLPHWLWLWLCFPIAILGYFLERYWFWFSVLGDCLAGETKTWPWRRLASVAALPNGHQVQLFYDFLLTNKLLKGYARQDAARTVAGAGKCIFTVRKYPYPAAEHVYKATCFASPYPIRIHLSFFYTFKCIPGSTSVCLYVVGQP